MVESEKRILIIDPDEKERNVIVTFLRQHNFLIETGNDLSDALKKVSVRSYGCLILDVDLREMKGFEAVSIFRSIDPKIKIIMTAKKNSMALEAKVREQDIYYYFIKSFDKDELRLAIANALNL